MPEMFLYGDGMRGFSLACVVDFVGVHNMINVSITGGKVVTIRDADVDRFLAKVRAHQALSEAAAELAGEAK